LEGVNLEKEGGCVMIDATKVEEVIIEEKEEL
jgi:hypothetical protein